VPSDTPDSDEKNMIAKTHRTPTVPEQRLRVERWMSKLVFTTKPDACLIDAFEMMRDHRIRHVPVIEGEKLVGIVSDRDVRSALPSRNALQAGSASLGESLLRARVSQVMTVMPITIAPGASIREAAQVMCRSKVGALPVVAEGRLVGILSAEDILWAFAEGEIAPGAPVRHHHD
jgi:acetoin utilization protein AcuB